MAGYEEGAPMVAGTVLKLSCTAISGNPPATITWYKNDNKVRDKKVIDRLVLLLSLAHTHTLYIYIRTPLSPYASDNSHLFFVLCLWWIVY